MSKFKILFEKICNDYIEISENKDNKNDLNFLSQDIEIFPIVNESLMNENNNIVENDIYHITYFINFFNCIKDIQKEKYLSYNKLKQIFLPIFNRVINLNQKYKDLYILKFPFYSKKLYLKAWNLLDIYKIINKETTETINKFYDEHILGNFSIGGFYIKIKNKNWSLMLLNEQNFNENTIKHELIHYFQDILGISIFNFIKSQDILNTYGLCQNSDLTLLFKEEEVVPYANEICYIFKNNGIKTIDDIETILLKFMNITNDDNQIYVNRCKQLKEYIWFVKENKQDIIEFFILSYIYSREVFSYIKLIIENYFKDLYIS